MSIMPSNQVEPFAALPKQRQGFEDLKTLKEEKTEMLRYGVQSALAGGIDTIGSSISPLDEKEMGELVSASLRNLGMEGTAQYYEQNRAGAKLTGELLTAFVPILKIPKLMQSGKALDQVLDFAGDYGRLLKPALISSGKNRKDRIDALKQEMDLFLKNKQTGLSEADALRGAIRKESLGAAFDFGKEIAMTDIALYAMYSDSDFFFPSDSPTTNFLLYAIPDSIFAVGAGLAARHSMRTFMQTDEFAQSFAAGLNPSGIKSTDVLSRKGTRGLVVADRAYWEAMNLDLARAADTPVDTRNAAFARATAAEKQMKEELISLGRDKYYEPSLRIDASEVWKDTNGEVRTALDAFKSEPSSAVGVTSLQSLHKDLQTDMVKHIRNGLINLDGKIKTAKSALNGLEPETTAYKAAQAEYHKWLSAKRSLDESTQLVIEVDGSFTPLALRRWSSVDELNTFKVAELDGTTQFHKDVVSDMGVNLAYSKNGILLTSLPAAFKEGTVNGVDIVRLLKDRKDIQAEIDNVALQNLEDMTYLFRDQDNTARVGSTLWREMPDEMQSALRSWKGSSDSGPIRQWAKTSPEKLTEMQDYFNKHGMEKRLLELADENGTIPLYRGTSRGESGKLVKGSKEVPDVVSMTPSPKFAAGWNESTVAVRVPVEDVIAMVDKPGMHEFEFIVKGHSRRGSQFNASATQKGLVFEQLNYKQKMAGWALTQKWIDKMDTPARVPSNIIVTDSRNYMELDAYAAILEKHPETLGNFKFKSSGTAPATVQEAVDQLRFQAHTKKFTEFQKHHAIETAEKRNMIKLSPEQKMSQYDFAAMLNLPSPTAIGEHPITQLYRSLSAGVGGDVKQLRSFVKNMDELREAAADFVTFGVANDMNAATTTIADYAVTGRSLLAKHSDKKRPVVAHYANRTEGRISGTDFNHMVSDLKEIQLMQMSQAKKYGANFVQELMNELNSKQDMVNVARRVDTLIDGTQAGAGVFTTQAFAARSNTVVETTDRIMDLLSRKSEVELAKIFESHNATLRKIKSHNHKDSRMLFDIALNERRNGWDLLPEPIQVAEGRWSLALDPKSARNKQMWEKFFQGRNFTDDLADYDGELLLPVRASALGKNSEFPKFAELDDLGIDTFASIQSLSHTFLDNLNFIRGVRGLSPINKRAWHVPYHNLTAKEKQFILNDKGEVYTVVLGGTQQEAIRKADETLALLQKDGLSMHRKSERELQTHLDNFGVSMESPVNFALSGTQTSGAKGKGGTPAIAFGTDVVSDVITQLQQNFSELTKYTMATTFESEIRFGRLMKESLQGSRDIVKSGKFASGSEKQAKAKTTIYDSYERALFQNNPLDANTEIGAVWYGLENTADTILAKLHDKFKEITPRAVTATASDFKLLDETLGSNNPFKDLAEMQMSITKTSNPLTSRAIAAKSNAIAVNAVLRILDLGMPIVNMASLASVAPPVVVGLQRLQGENLVDWKRRIGAYGSPINNTTAIPNSSRMMIKAVEGMFDKETKAAVDRAAKKGFMKQEAAEQITRLASPNDTELGAKMRETINTLSWMTDKSEVLSRKVSFSMFWKIGKDTMKLNDDAAEAFAHIHANQVVGDYRPSNKPQIFQGATGMPLGLFTTWVWNAMQRVYGNAERGQVRALLTQGGMQSMLFGAESMPGFDILVNEMTQSYAGDRSILDTLDEAWGSTFTDVLIHGGVSSATKLFGLDSGIAVQSRADITLPALFGGVASGDISQAVPAVKVWSDWLTGTGRIVESLKQNDGVNSREIAEAISVYGVNGFIKNMMQLSLGYSVDRGGQVVNSDVYNPEDILARMVELRSNRELDKMRAIRRDRVANEIKQERLRKVRHQLRSAFRGDSVDKDIVEQSLQEYYKAGGSPEHFRRFLREQVMASRFEKPQRMLMEALRANELDGGTARLILYYTDDRE